MFDLSDYRRGAGALAAPSKNLMAVIAVESSGETCWTIGNRQVPPIRPEAQWFSKLTDHRFDASDPDISSPTWRPELAARSKAAAWQQFERMSELAPDAAVQATSWGAAQIMGFHWKALGYPSVQAFYDAVAGAGPDGSFSDDGQMDMFVRFVRADDRLLRAIRTGDWETWETVYNGGGYGGAYAAKVRAWLEAHGEDGGPSSPSMSPTVPRVLRKGYRGPDVARLQQALGLALVDGDFGQQTEDAVKAYQSCTKGMVVDGVAGIMTLRALGLAK